jgi:hypothetical protein
MQNMFHILIYTDYKLSSFTLYIKITITKIGYSENICVFNAADVKPMSHVHIVVIYEQ